MRLVLKVAHGDVDSTYHGRTLHAAQTSLCANRLQLPMLLLPAALLYTRVPSRCFGLSGWLIWSVSSWGAGAQHEPP